jgi:hypothetical protein
MSTRWWGSAVLVLALATGGSVSADQIKLKSGKVIEGIFIGGDSRSVRILLDNGSVSEVALHDAASVEFTERKPAPPPGLLRPRVRSRCRSRRVRSSTCA